MSVAELTHKTPGPDFTARFDGSCTWCHEPVWAADDIVAKVDGVDGIFHSLCARAYCSTINEEVDLREAERSNPRQDRIRQLCRDLRLLDVPDDAVAGVERFADSLDRSVA